MPISQLLKAMDPPAAEPATLAGPAICVTRDFVTVALVVPWSTAFRDNWIYVHSKEVQVGRIQNFGSWSPYMVKEDAPVSVSSLRLRRRRDLEQE